MSENINDMLGIDANIEVTGPYFFGQKPEKCGHYSPDVLLYMDSLNGGNKAIRTKFCFKCKTYFYEEIGIEQLSSSNFKESEDGKDRIYGTLEELAEIRKNQLRIIFSRSDW
jgi:hypothetical protein